MIFRIWHGWTRPPEADRYETLLRTDMLPSIAAVAGCHGAYLLRRSDGDDIEFVTICVFDDVEAVRRFAGENYETPVLHPEAEKLLTRWDQRSLHYDVLLNPEQVRAIAGGRQSSQGQKPEIEI
jgi:hypothetical protein